MNTALFNKTLRLLILIVTMLFFTLLPKPIFANQLKTPLLKYSLNNIYFVKECDEGNTRRVNNGVAKVSGSTADEKIWSALMSLDITAEVAAGILGNIHNEGGASPVRHEGCYEGRACPVGIALDGSSSNPLDFDYENDEKGCKIGDTETGCGVGLIQWSFRRRTNLFKFAREKNSALVDKYLKHPEIYGGYRGENFIKTVNNEADVNELYAIEVEFLVNELKTDSTYGGVLKQLTVAEAAEYYSMYVERCNNGCLVKDSQENKERIAAAEQIYQLFHDKTSFGSSSSFKSSNPCDCNDSGELIGGGLYAGAKYNITDEDTLKRLWWAAETEQGESGEEGIKSELTFFANRFEHCGGTPGDAQGLINSVNNQGPCNHDYDSHTPAAYQTGENQWDGGYLATPTPEQISIVKDILVNGNRTMPIQIANHDSIKDITEKGGVSNNGVSFSPSEKNQYISGTTYIESYENSTFYQWANGEKVCSSDYRKCGDPFSYFVEPSASTLTTKETGSTTWDDNGWITGGLDGYTKEDGTKMKKLSKTANQDFTTDMPNTKGKGPTKITITATEGPNGAGTSGLELFKSKKTSKPPHFTIDLQDKKVYQHFPVYKTSGANTSTDDGIYIAVIGYTDADKAKQDNNEKWSLSSLSASDYSILSDLIQAINNVTGVDSNNITGPETILTNLQKAIASATPTSDCGSGDTGNIIADTAIKLSWDCGDTYACHSQGSPPYEPKPEYVTAMQKADTYDDPGGWGYGASCDRFVATVMRYSKADENFPIGYANDSGGYLIDHPELYEEIPFNGSNFEVLQPGDIFSTYSPRNSSGGHIWIYVTINGEHGRADASNGEKSGRTAEHRITTPKINDGRDYKVFRRK